MMNRYSPASDGRDFRLESFAALADRYRPVVHDALALLQAVEFEFPALTKAHVEQLRPDLLFRQSLPFCVTEETFFALDGSSSPVLAALFAGHTLALTHLDYHLDGSTPDPSATATALKMEPTTAVAYSVRVMLTAARILDEVANGQRLFQHAFDPVSGFVLARMHQDWLERYDPAQLSDAAARLGEYLNSPTSRLMGSGYWELMIRGSFVRHGARCTPGIDVLAATLRKLRQAVDEIADFDEDLRAGLATTPLLFALAGLPGAAASVLAEAVRSAWSSNDGAGGGFRDAAVAECRKLVCEAGGFERAAEFADGLWRSGVAHCERTWGPAADGYLLLLDLKRAKLQELRSSGWRNVRTERFFA
jgi:hypothetical protein